NKRKIEGPPELDRSELKLAVQLCAVLEPLRLATRLIEAEDRALCSLYLPLFHQCSETLGKNRGALPLPKELRKAFGENVQISSLLEVPNKLRLFLAADLKKIRERHLVGTTGDDLLAVATFLDGRFQKHHVWQSMLSLEDTKNKVAQMALQASQDFPALVERLRKQAQDPVNWTLAALAKAEAAPKPRGRGGRGGRGRGRARAQSDPAPKSRCASEAALQETTPSGHNLKRRRLQPQTSAEEWLFGQPEQQEEEVVLADVDAVKQQISEELTCYLRLGHASQLGSSPLSFWKNRRSELPFLSALARIIYSIPASTAALERLFSAAGRAVCHRRPRLNVRKAAKLIFAHANVARNITGRIGAKKPVEE
ncbi:unnamed protein product, partial [Cladocopium goreaui]